MISLLMNLRESSPVFIIWISAIFLGLSYGSWDPSLSVLTSFNFGMIAYGSIYGLFHLFDMVGGAIGPLVDGYIYDLQSSYHVAFIIFASLVLVSLIATFFITKPASTSEKY